MEERYAGGPAFPVATADGYMQEGMDLRDYFAANVFIPWSTAFEHALDRLGEEGTYLGGVPVDEVLKSRAILRYVEADAMLAARES